MSPSKPPYDLDDTPPPLDMDPLTETSLLALNNLVEYTPREDTFPMERRAAVMVALFPGRHGDLYVLLNTRALTLRSHPGEVSLPGGKWEQQDASLVHTARREAWEEIGLEIDSDKIRFLTLLEPFYSRAGLIVTPVVCLIIDPYQQPSLNPSEVSSIFSHPLEAFLFHEPIEPQEPVLHSLPRPIATGEQPYHTFSDSRWPSPDNPPYRFHTFQSKKQRIWGLTADILIQVAEIAYSPRKPQFERKAPGQLDRVEIIASSFSAQEDEMKLPVSIKRGKANL
ncbi:hypothetical protein BT69DRAFT_1258997 [Atractiella rhizophila]|nr:hypothetical protein BT69DRAFT_1258997 [Atractiella rhizophila]